MRGAIMKKGLLITSCTLLVSMGMLALAQQGQGLSDLQRQLQRLNETTNSGPGTTSDIHAPVSPTSANPVSPGASSAGGPPGPTVSPGNSGALPTGFTPSPTTQPSLATGAPQTGTVDLNALPNPNGVPAPAPEVILPPVRDEAFAETVKSQIPMTPEQIRTLKSMFDEAQKAAAEHPGAPPKPTSNSQIVDLSPGATPPIIRLQGGFVTSIVFLDATGAPWPIVAYDLGDPRSFNIQWDQKGNTLMVQAISGYKTGNLAVVLQNLNTPIMVTLLPGQKAVDYRVDLRLPGLGPNSVTTVTHLPGKEAPALLDVLNGVPPQGSTTLKISGCSKCNAWLYNGEIFFRTRFTVLSPGWIATLTSADGMHAYQLPSTPVILVSDKGKMNTLTVEGF
jgi:intracellular multiplication protein IcmK